MIEKRKPLKYLDDTSGAAFSLRLRYEALRFRRKDVLLLVCHDQQDRSEGTDQREDGVRGGPEAWLQTIQSDVHLYCCVVLFGSRFQHR